MNIKDTISGVLQKRRSHAPNLERINNGLFKLQGLLDNLQKMSNQSDQEVPNQKELIETALSLAKGLQDLKEEVIQLTNSVSNIAKRFSRGTINIGVAGTAKNGKSTLLQKISGLSNTEIPAEIVPCTGTMSKVFHIEDHPYAVIEFYSKQEFLREILYPYFERLGLQKPLSLEEFSSKSLPEVEVPEGPERHIFYAVLSELKRIHTAFPSFREFLDRIPETVKLEAIQEYIVKSADRTRYLAVKTANIYTKFPNHNVTGLCLVDLPGLEAAEGFEKKLVASLGQQVDAVILVKMPKAGGAVWEEGDFKVIGLINSAIEEINLADWLFVALNKLNDDSNQGAVQYLSDNPAKIYGSKPLHLIANFYNADQADQRIFSPVLRHIEQNLEDIDRQHVKRLAQKMDTICDALSKLLMPAHAEFRPKMDDFKLFPKLANKFIKKLEDGLVELLEKQQSITFEDFETKVREVCDMAKQAHRNTQPPILPTVDELKRERRREKNWFETVPRYIKNLRRFLICYLTENLDIYFSKRVDEVLEQLLIDIFPESLRNLSVRHAKATLSEPRSIVEGLQKLLDKSEQPNLYSSFGYIIKFNLCYGTLFEYLVRSEIGLLDTGHPKGHEAIQQLTGDKDVERAEEIMNGLDKFYQDTIYQISEKLLESQLDPAETVVSWIEGISDRLVTTEAVENEWIDFLGNWRGELWPEEFGEIVRTKLFYEKWKTAMDEVLTSAKQIRENFPV